MVKKERSGHAFPTQTSQHYDSAGMNLRQYAAIKLKVPDSGIDWLDEMIKESRRLDECKPIKSNTGPL